MWSRFDRVARWCDYEVRRTWLRCLLFTVDRIGCLLVRRADRRRAAKELRRILVVRPEHFGDLLLTLPALRRLRAAFPSARLIILVRLEYAGWMESLDLVDEVWGSDISWTRRNDEIRTQRAPRDERADSGNLCELAIIFHPDLRNILLARRYAPEVAGYGEGGGGFLLAISCRHHRTRSMLQVHLDLIAAIQARYGGAPSSGAAEQPLRRRKMILPVRVPGPYLILHPGAGQPAKLWFPERWVQVAAACRTWGWSILLTGSAEERSLCAAVAAGLAPNDPSSVVLNLAGQTSLTELTALVTHAQAVVAPDTGIIHLAAALETPSVALFGPNDPRQWGYSSHRHRSLAHPQPCSFCRLGSCPRTDAPRACLRAIRTEEVLATLQQVVREKRDWEEANGNPSLCLTSHQH